MDRLKTTMEKDDRGLLFVQKTLRKEGNDSIYQKTRDYVGRLGNLSNILTYTSVKETKAEYEFERPYIYTNLYERLSTRPFLVKNEKLWISFQILYGMSKVHELGLVHGDLKLENILVTSWYWVYVTDFASHKPTVLPEDDPYTFSHQFDSSYRHCCNLSPERFADYNVSLSNDTKLSSKMDIFSLGCILAEIYTESPLFSYSQLILYRRKKFDPSAKLQNIEDEELRHLVTRMIDIDSEKRPDLSEILVEYRKKIFCDYFYKTFHGYCNGLNDFDFHHFLNWSVDHSDVFENLMVGNVIPSVGDCKIMKLVNDADIIVYQNETNYSIENRAQLYCSLVLPWIRNTSSKVAQSHGFSLIGKLSDLLPDSYKLERILPYLSCFAKDKSNYLRSMALRLMVGLLKSINEVSPSEANIFSAYLIPTFQIISKDGSELSRCTLSAILGELSRISKVFIDYIDDEFNENQFTEELFTYDASLLDLKDSIQDIFVNLITKNSKHSKISLMRHSYESLSLFFGKEITDNLLTAHLVTFMSDPYVEVRSELQSCILPLIQHYNDTNLESLTETVLTNGLGDKNCFVILNSIQSCLALKDKLKRETQLSMLTLACPFLLHYFERLRLSVRDFVLTVLENLTYADCLTLLLTTLKPFLNVGIFEPKYFCDVIIEPLPLLVWNKIYQIIEKDKRLLQMLKSFQNDDVFSEISEEITPLSNFHFSKMEALLLYYGRHHFINCLNDKLNHEFEILERSLKNYTVLLSDDFGETLENVGEELIFRYIGKSSNSLHTDMTAFLDMSSFEYYGMNKSVKTYLILKYNEYFSQFRYLLGISSSQTNKISYSLKGVRIGKLLEHNGSVNCLRMSQDGSFFTSCSSDGTVKVWDCKRLERNVANSSRATAVVGGNVNCLDFCQGSNSIVCASDNGTILFHKIEYCGSYKYTISNALKIIDNENQECMALQQYCMNQAPLLTFATIQNNLKFVDLRIDVANNFKIPSCFGLSTALSINQHTVSVGTSRGNILSYDMRFLKDFSDFCIPSKKRITSLKYYNSLLYASSSSGELSIWDIYEKNCLKYFNSKMLDSKALPLIGRDDFIANRLENEEFGGLMDILCLENTIIAAGADGTVKVVPENPICNEKQEYSDAFNSKYKVYPPHYIQQISTGQILHEDAINSLCYTNNPYNILMTASQNGSICLWK
eukprot:NODE_217_length_12479_cov_0.651212.p1 type:complete len:1187 gc:universal NODE_217_length_12479_cov_0.651212:8036-11596(+)